jgi:hypothetical protein
MDSEFLAAITATVDPSVNATLLDATKPTFASRPSGSTAPGFYRPGERPKCLLDGDNNPYPIEDEPTPIYTGPPSGHAPTDDEKRAAWHLENEYFADRLGKNKEENARLWNTAKWVERHHRIATMPAESLAPFNIHIADATVQDTGAPTGADDESPDDAQENEGAEFERIHVGKQDSPTSMRVMDEDGVTRRLEIKADDYDVMRLADQLDECDKLAKVDVNEAARKPLPESFDYPDDPDDFAESGKIIRILMAGMHTLWTPVIRAVVDRVTMHSLGSSQGVGDDKAATVGRWRVIEGLRLADSIRRRLERQKLAPAKPALRKYRSCANVPSVNEMMAPLVAKPVHALYSSGRHLNQTAGPVIKVSQPANDNQRLAAAA